MSDGLAVALVAGYLGLIGTGVTLWGSWLLQGGAGRRTRQQLKEELELLQLLEGHDAETVAALRAQVDSRLASYVGATDELPANAGSEASRRAERRRLHDAMWTAAPVPLTGVAIAVVGFVLAERTGATAERPLVHDLPTGLLALTVIVTTAAAMWGLVRLVRIATRKARSRTSD